MKDKVALVTGSSRGIGRAIALRLADDVGTVVVHFKQDQKNAEETVRSIKSKDASTGMFSADLTDREGTIKLIDEVKRTFGKIDILVNNFGPIIVKDWDKFSDEEWDAIIRSNLHSARWAMEAVLPEMREQKWGRIINLGYNRVEEISAFMTITPYAVAKTGLLILTRTAAKNEAPNGITVNMVSPGLIEGGVLPQNKKVPIGRTGTPQDVAAAVGFLCSEKAGYITGANLVVAGGWKL